MKAAFATLGCKVNHYETQAMRELFVKAGWEVVDFAERADVYIINTCTVTAVSDKKSRNLFARAHALNPDALLAAVGCYAQTAPDAVRKLPGVGLILGTSGRAEIVERVTQALHARDAGGCAAPDAPDLKTVRTFEELSAIRDGRTRATLKIQDGCRNFCSYCAIPYARGLLRSRSMESIGRELATLAAEGYREVVLTGIHLASYGIDLPERPSLLDVLRLADGVPGVTRVRIGSLEPRYVTEAFAREAAALPSLCRQFHLSLQSGSDAVLARMNRRYTTEEYAQSVARLRKYMPDCAVTTDVIAGFPGETEAEHETSMAFVEEMAFSRIHVFPYSRRPGTAADAMPGHLERSVRESRAKALIRLGERLQREFLLSQLGTVQEVLLETDGTGYTRNYVRVRLPGAEGAVKRALLTGIDGELAIGKEID